MPDEVELPEQVGHAGPDNVEGSVTWAGYLPGQELVPAYLVSRFAAQYRAIVEVLLAAQDSSLTGLSFDDVEAGVRRHLAERLPRDVAARLLNADEFALDARLQRLEQWRVITRWQDLARTGEDFLRRRDRYQLTVLAARLHAFWLEAPDADDEAAADLTLAPRAIGDRLETFAEALVERRYPAAAAEFQQLIALHHAMAVAARTWQRGLAHALSGGPDPDKQETLWRTLQAYIGMWGEQVDVNTPRIAAMIESLAPTLTGQVWGACVRAALGAEAGEELIDAQATRWSRTWTALTSWFCGPDAQGRRLRRQLRDLVAPWARNTTILMSAGGVVTRRADLLQLARAIERAPDDESAWQLWDTAVGVFSARHLLLPAEAAENNSLSWTDARPAPVTARYREQGIRAAVGRRARAADHSAGRAAARRARISARAQRSEAEARLAGRSGSTMSSWSDVSEAELELLTELLGLARRAGGGQVRSALTGDGRWRVTLTPPTSGGGVATINTSRGTLVTTDWLFALDSTR